MNSSTVLSRLEEVALLYPERPALECTGQRLSYAELWQRSEQFALALKHHVSGERRTIALYTHKRLEAYIALLGILRAGHHYVPLDPEAPAKRNTHILDQFEPLCVIRDDSESWQAVAPQLSRSPKQVLDLHALLQPPRSASKQSLPTVPAASTAYVLFTSGSTGTPKGVVVKHRQLLLYAEHASDTLQLCPSDRVSQFSALNFDLSVHDIWCAWLNAACLVVVPPLMRVLATEFIRQHQLSVWMSVPTVIDLAAQLNRLEPQSLPSLRASVFCGQPLYRTAAQRWQSAAPNSQVWNFYGPTESTVCCSAHAFEPQKDHAPQVPIGHAFDAIDIKLIDENDQEILSHDQPGEILILGAQNASGYWQSSQPGFCLWQGQRAYRSGDYAYRNRQGQLVYSGRRDQQLKVLGHRIELLEVEARLKQVSGASSVAVLPLESDPNGDVRSLIAYYQCETPQSADHIAHHLCQWLPHYAVPQQFVALPHMPLNANGKVDRQALVHNTHLQKSA